MYLGLDLGTSALKALLIDDNQRIAASASADLNVSRPASGWSEQQPADWIKACETALDALKADHGQALAAVRGIGLSGQMHGATLLDEVGEPLRPCTLWNDTRAHKEAAALDADPRFRAISGNIVFPGFTAPKIAWVKAKRAEGLRSDRQGSAAQGFSQALADGRMRLRDVRRRRHELAGCRWAVLVPCPSGGNRA